MVEGVITLAQEGGGVTDAGFEALAHGLVYGLAAIGPGVGVGLVFSSAISSMARQPEMAGNIQTAMIISAALIEGVTFFALIIIGFILTA